MKKIYFAFLEMLNRTDLMYPLAVMYHGLKDPSSIKKEIQKFRRYLRFRAKYKSIVSGPKTGSSTRKKVMMVCLFNEPFMLEYVCGLMKGLEVNGYEPVVLTSTRDLSYFYYRMFGIKNILFYSDYLRRVKLDYPKGKPLQPISEFRSIQELKDYRYHGARVGQHVLSLVSRVLRQGNVSLENPEIVREMESHWSKVDYTVRAVEKIYDDVKPQASLFLEIGYFPYGEFFDISLERGINTVEYTGSHKIQYVNLKRYRKGTADMHPQSLSPETWEKIRKSEFTKEMDRALMKEIEEHYESGGWTNEERLQYGKEIKDKETVIRQIGLNPSKKTAVIFSHILWDATFFYGSDLFDNYAEWLVETVRAACENTNLNWIVKLHPANIWKLQRDGAKISEQSEITLLKERLGTIPDHIKFIEPATDINTYSLFELTDYCLTVRGTIGIEMPCYGIPTFVAGTGRYAGYGFTNESSTREEYIGKLKRLESFPRMSDEEVLLARKHAHALFLRRPLDLQTIQFKIYTDKKSGGLSERDIVIRSASAEEFANAPDLAEFSKWIMESTESDYLSQAGKIPAGAFHAV